MKVRLIDFMTRNNQLELKDAPPIFEGFVLQMMKAGQRRKAREIVTRVLGAGWKIEEFGGMA